MEGILFVLATPIGSSSVQKPVKLTDDVKQRKQKAKRLLNNNQTPAQANETKKISQVFTLK